MTDAENFTTVQRLAISSPGDFVCKPTQQLYNWWTSFAPGIPKRSDFHIEEHWPLAPNLFLCEYLGDRRFRYRLNGEEVVRLVGQNQAGNFYGNVDDIEELYALTEYHLSLLTSKEAKRCIGTLDALGRKHIKFESVDCPLLDENGDARYILGVLSSN